MAFLDDDAAGDREPWRRDRSLSAGAAGRPAAACAAGSARAAASSHGDLILDNIVCTTGQLKL
eukprot:4506463-Prymnesium_polylepis.1